MGYILTGVASGADRPLIVDENFVEWEIRNEKCEMVVRRIKIWKRRGVLIALRAHRHLERSREIFIAERSSLDVRQH